MKRIGLAMLIALALVSVAHAEGVVSAVVAAAKLEIPTPSFEDVHEAYFRIVTNEAGPKSLADQDGILMALLSAGGGRNRERTGQGAGYGLDYRKLMAAMAAYSPRTFPVGSPFLQTLTPERIARAIRQRTYQNEWTSTLGLDCRQPSLWSEEKSGLWAGYLKRCQFAVDSTRRVLMGQVQSYCTGLITTWGSFDDRHRKGGPIDEGWAELLCDRPPLVAGDPPADECPRLREQSVSSHEANRRLLNSTNCARNYFFSWRTRVALK